MQTSSRSSTFVIAWTGHRDLPDESVVRRAIDEVLDRLLAQRGGAWAPGQGPCPLVGMGPVAIGSDLLVGEALLRRGIPLAIVLPLEADRLEEGEAPHLRARIATLLAGASAVSVVPRQPTKEDAFLEAGVTSLDDADVLMAVWDGQPARGVGGTGDAVAAARRRGTPIVRIDPASGRIEWPSEAAATDAIAETATPRMDSHAAGRARFLRSRSDVEALFTSLDAQASGRAHPTRRVLVRVVVLHLLATAMAVTALLVDPLVHRPELPLVAALIKVSLLLLAVWLAARFRPSHHEWLELRVEAELCRSFLAIWTMRRDVVVPPPAPTVASQTLRRELGLAWRLDVPAHFDLDAARRGYSGGEGNGRLQHQMRYFTREQAGVRHIDRTIRIAAPIATWLAIASAVAAIALHQTIQGADKEGAPAVAYATAKGMSILLPLATAAMLSYATAIDLLRRSGRFAEMMERLKAIRQRADAAPTWPALGRAVTDAEWLMQSELAEWHAFNRYAGEIH